ncbi:lipase secretion chaperone [Aeromonas bivalvium]|uniref:lipase secretion chaperone n=1 Tax=Aeromonas bivalvium TaxID=440079 RepID=UPI0038D21026
MRGLALAALGLLCALLGHALYQQGSDPAYAQPAGATLRQQLVERLASGQPIEDPLLARYRDFLGQEARLPLPKAPDLASLTRLFEARDQLRRLAFTPEEQTRLFAEERLMEQWTLRRKALAEAPPAERAQLGEALALWLAEQPDWFQEAESNGRLIGDLQRIDDLPPEERRLALLERVGPEAQGRLQQLAQEQQAFEQRLAGYLTALAAQGDPAPEADRQLLAAWFPESQWRRVAALTRLRQGQSAPQ